MPPVTLESIKNLIPVFESTSFLIALIGVEGPTLYMNPAGYELLGADPDSPVMLSDYRPDWAKKHMRETIFPEANENGAWAGKTFYLDRNGEQIPVYQSIVLLDNPESREKVIFTTAKKLDEKLDETAEFTRDEFFARLIFHKSNQPIFVIDNTSRMIVDANPAWLKLMGYSSAEINQVSVYDVVPRPRETVNETLNNAIKNVEFTVFDGALWKAKNGKIIPVIVTVIKLFVNREYLVVMGHDITERIKAEQAIRESEQKYRNLVQQLSDGLLYLGPQGRINFANHRFCEITGYPEAELDGLSPWEMLVDENDKQGRENITWQETGGNSMDIRLIRKDGRRIWTRISTSPLLGEGGIISGTIALVRDISSEMNTRFKLEYKKRELDTFIYRASHDLKAPLNSLQGLVRLGMEETQEESALQYFQLIGKVADKLNSSLVGLLELTLLKEGLASHQPVDVHQLAEEVFQSQPAPGRFEFRNSFPEGIEFITDAKLLRVVLQHLFQNAIRFQESQERPSFIHFEGHVSARGLVFLVRDNGPGIPPESQSKVFDMFYRATQLGSGSGLGLYITKNAVERLGGEISLKSKPGEGTEFLVEIAQVDIP